ncbi:MAG TPA: OmpA family protein [Sphingomicrobium sp.]|jgi:hypothetical protein|nr:OmpA family protein [Sphingomicrobium sp.]
MATAGRLDRKAKGALIGLLLVVALILVLIVRTAIVAVTPDSLVAAPTPQSQDEIMQLGRHTILLKHGSTGNKIARWLHAGSKSSRAFEVSDAVFEPNSDTLSGEGEKRVVMFSDMIKQVDSVEARILVSTSTQNANLAQRRAERLRAALLQKNVPSSRIDVSPEPIKGGAGLSSHPELVVVLST